MNAPYTWPLDHAAPLYDLQSDLAALRATATKSGTPPEQVAFHVQWRDCARCRHPYPPTARDQTECYSCQKLPHPLFCR